MGTIEKGYLGGFKGILGTAVGSKWKGKSVIKSRPPAKRTTQSTALQLQQQAKVKLLIVFLKPIRTLLNLTLKKPAGGDMSGHNMAFSINKDAITGLYPAFSIDYSKVLLSQGSLVANRYKPISDLCQADRRKISDSLFVGVVNIL